MILNYQKAQREFYPREIAMKLQKLFFNYFIILLDAQGKL